jgi:hypothetical protein
MDSLTKRLMSTSGINKAKPLLPPVEGLRVVHLDEPFSDADVALHVARLALKGLEIAQRAKPPSQTAIEQARNDVYDTMAKLEVKERDYFANRYFGRDRAVLKGWNVDRKQQLFKEKIDAIIKDATDRRDAVIGFGSTSTAAAAAVALYGASTKVAADAALAAATTLKSMNDKWTPSGGSRVTVTPPGFDTDLKIINSLIDRIHKKLRDVWTEPNKDLRVASVKNSLRDAETCQRLAHLVMNDQWDLPDELRKPAAP